MRLSILIAIALMILVLVNIMFFSFFNLDFAAFYSEPRCVNIKIILPQSSLINFSLELEDSYKLNEESFAEISTDFYGVFGELNNDTLWIFINGEEIESFNAIEEENYTFKLDTTIQSGLKEKTIFIKGNCLFNDGEEMPKDSLDILKGYSYSILTSGDLSYLEQEKISNALAEKANTIAKGALSVSIVSLLIAIASFFFALYSNKKRKG